MGETLGPASIPMQQLDTELLGAMSMFLRRQERRAGQPCPQRVAIGTGRRPVAAPRPGRRPRRGHRRRRGWR